MVSLTAAEIIPLWLSLATASVAFLFFFGFAFWLTRSPGTRKKQAHASAAMFSALVIAIATVSIISQQPMKTRSDGVEAWWGRWVAYSIVWGLFGWATANVLSNNGGLIIYAAIGASVLGSVSAVLAVLSSHNSVWLWYSVTGGLWLTAMAVYVYAYWAYGKPYAIVSFNRIVFMLAILGLDYIGFYLFLGLGHAIGNVLTVTGDRWGYFGCELIWYFLFLMSIMFENDLIPRRFMGYGKGKPNALRSKAGTVPLNLGGMTPIGSHWG